MIDNTFLRSYKLVPEVNRPFLYSSLIAMAATLIRMIGPQLISRGIDNGVLKSDYNYLLEQSFYYFLNLCFLKILLFRLKAENKFDSAIYLTFIF